MVATPQKAAPKESKTAIADAIAPSKRQLTWKTPFQYGGDFIKGTFTGMSEGLSKGARFGLKMGLLVGAALFFAPVVPFIASMQASMGLLAVGSGFEALAMVAAYGVAGAVAGTVTAGALGTVTGGAREMQYRWRRETYAEAMADKLVMQQQRAVRPPTVSWRDYARAYEANQNNQLFVLNQQMQDDNSSQRSWVDRVANTFGDNQVGR